MPLDHARVRACVEPIAKAMVTLVPLKEAAWAAGVPSRTFLRWWSRGEAAHERLMDAEDAEQELDEPPDDTVLRELYERIRSARAQGVIDAAARVRMGKPGWQGSAWTLERRDREEYAPPHRYEISGPAGGPISTITGEESLARLTSLLTRDLGGTEPVEA